MSEPTLRYEIEYDGSFERQVREGEANPLCGFRIVVGDEDLAGAPPGESYVDDYMYFHFRKVLGEVPAVVDGERRAAQLYSVSDYLVFHPEDGDVYVALQSPGEFEAGGGRPEGARRVGEEALVTGIADAAEEFRDRLLAVNPSLADDDEIAELTEAVERVRSIDV